MDRERGKPMADDTIFRIYSMTKPITSVALMTLYEQGYFQLNDPVHRVIPEWRDQRVWVSGEGDEMETEEPDRPVTFRDMLSHTGGLTYGAPLATLGAPAAAIRSTRPTRELEASAAGAARPCTTSSDKLAQVPLRYQPGERWMYSLSTDVCGALVEIISGKRFDKYLQETSSSRCGMKDTAFSVRRTSVAASPPTTGAARTRRCS